MNISTRYARREFVRKVSLTEARAYTSAPPSTDSIFIPGLGVFNWDGASTATDDGSTVIKITAVTTGRWILDTSIGGSLSVSFPLATVTKNVAGGSTWEDLLVLPEVVDPRQDIFVKGFVCMREATGTQVQANFEGVYAGDPSTLTAIGTGISFTGDATTYFQLASVTTQLTIQCLKDASTGIDRDYVGYAEYEIQTVGIL